MSNLLNSILLPAILVTFSVSLFGQSSEDLTMLTASSSTHSTEMDLFSTPKTNKYRVLAKKSESSENEEIFFDISSVESISTFDPAHYTLNVASNDQIKYDYIQLTNTDTQEIVLEDKMSDKNYTINLNELATGKYMLIISNDSGNVKSEKLFVSN